MFIVEIFSTFLCITFPDFYFYTFSLNFLHHYSPLFHRGSLSLFHHFGGKLPTCQLFNLWYNVRMSWISSALLQILLFINSLTGSLGWTIVIFTILFRGLLLAFTYRSLKSMSKMRALSGEIKQLQQEFKDDPEGFNKAQLALYQKYNVNPLSGCLPQLLQIFMLVIFYRVLISYLGSENLGNTLFLWFDLTKPDPLHLIPLLAGAGQFLLSVMTLPGGETPDIIPNDSSKKAIQKANQKEEDSAQMAATMQKQMLFMMPLMTGAIAWRLPAGLGLYWITSTLFSIVQQYYLSGWGGLTLYFKRFVGKFSQSDHK